MMIRALPLLPLAVMALCLAGRAGGPRGNDGSYPTAQPVAEQPGPAQGQALPAAAKKTPGAQASETNGTAPLSSPLSPPDSAGRPPGVAIVFSCVLQVEESEAAAKTLIARAESLGGWFTRRSKSAIELRIPAAGADSFIAGLAAIGAPLDRNLSTESLEGQRAELASRLRARRAMLQDYYAMLKESGDSTVFTIQSEIVNLQTEIEETAGQIGKLEERMAFANVTVSFRFFERGAPLTTGQSRFRWLNRLDLPTLMRRYEYVDP
jgi:hypothetical protein